MQNGYLFSYLYQTLKWIIECILWLFMLIQKVTETEDDSDSDSDDDEDDVHVTIGDIKTGAPQYG